MDNITRIVSSGVCTGCNACDVCKHITFAENEYGFLTPVVDEECTNCGKCVKLCIYGPERDDDDDE